MKKVLTILMVGALIVTLAVPVTFATQWDPECPPPYLQTTPNRPAGDDTGWVSPDDKSNKPDDYVNPEIIDGDDSSWGVPTDGYRFLDTYTFLNFLMMMWQR